MSLYSTLESETNLNTHESEEQDSADQEIETEIIFLAEEVKEAEVLSWWNSNKKKYTYLVRFAKRYLSTLPSSVYSRKFF